MTNAPTIQPVPQFVTADNSAPGNKAPADLSPVISAVPATLEQVKVETTKAVETATPDQKGPLSKAIEAITIFLAKIMKLPNPKTGEEPVATAKPTEEQAPAAAKNLGAQVWDKAEKIFGTAQTVANKAVEVTTKAVDLTTSAVGKAAEQMKKVIPQQVAPAPEQTPTQTQSLDTLTK